MARTLQKRIKFSKGQIVPDLVERTDLELYDSSAQVMKNVVSTVYGGVRTRRGTVKIDRLYRYSTSEVISADSVTAHSAHPEYLESIGTEFVTSAIEDTKEMFALDYGALYDGVFHIRGIKFDYRDPVVTYTYKEQYLYYDIKPTLVDGGVGCTSAMKIKTGKGKSFNFTLNGAGAVVSVSQVSSSKKESGTATIQRNEAPRVYPCNVEVSDDGVTYTTAATIYVNEVAKDYDITVEGVQYVRLVIDSADTINTTMSLNYVSFNEAQDEEDTGALLGNTKLLKLVYNSEDYFVLVLSDETIQIYKDDVCVAKVVAMGLSEAYFDDLKYTTKDDTIIFTHEDMEPKILKRVNDTTWSYGTLALDNIPYAIFGNETVAPKTVGITPSETEGAIKITADSSVFDSSWVGQYIDGNGGRVKITQYTSDKIVNGVTVIPFYTKDKITSWNYISGYEPVWSNTRGYPRTCLFAQQRLWFGGSKEKPASVWASRLGDYFNFKNSGNNANDSIDADLTTNDKIVNMIENRGIHIFTTGQEITAKENSYTPDDFTVSTNSNNGSLGRVTPVCFDGVTAFIERNGKSLLTYLYNDSVAAYETNNISIFSNLIQAPVDLDVEVNSSKDKGNFVYIVLEDGTMLVDCVSLNEGIQSISQFVTDGKITDVLSTPNETYLIVRRSDYNYLEKITETKTDLTVLYGAYDTSIDVLSDLNDKDVWVYDDENVYGKYTVTNGVVTLPSVLNKDVYIGQNFDFEVESNPISINGLTYSIKKRISKATLVCKNTERLGFNEQVKRYEDVYNFYDCTKYDYDTRFNISGEFYPINVMSVTLNINYEG